MEQNNEIKNLQELLDWIDNSKICFVSEQEDNYFRIEATNSADVFINLETDDDIENILCSTIELLEKFNTDERFMELWSEEFAEHNHFTPSQFIRMLQEDEASFKELAMELRKLIN